MNFRHLKWIALSAPIFFVGILEYARWVLGPALNSLRGHLLMDGVVLVCALFFYGGVFTILNQMQRKLERRNRELAALRDAGLDVTADLALDSVLRKVVDLACNLIGTRYGALAVIDDSGKIRNFVTTGLSVEEIRRVGPTPVGKGLLGVVLREGQRLRLSDMRTDARSAGVPEHHPEMRSLLAVPIVCRGPLTGNLYLSEKLDGTAFTEDEEATLARFATQAAIAVDNAHLHMQVRSLAVSEERLRIAHELHDGQAQVLAYVNTKAQVVQEFLRQGKVDKAGQQLEQLAAAARQVYADVREGILGLRAVVNSENSFTEALRQHLETWQDQCGIQAELSIDGEPRLTPDVELQLLRIAQEALANVRKHSAAEHAQVRLEAFAGGVRIRVEDDGKGFETDGAGRPAGGRPRFGLATMRERAEAIGARLELASELGRGTCIEVEYAPARNTARRSRTGATAAAS